MAGKIRRNELDRRDILVPQGYSMRRRTRQVRIGKVRIGGKAPVSIQSMSKTDTRDVVKTAQQINRLISLGCEVIRVAVKDRESASAISKIKRRISIPLEADIHFDYRLALLAQEAGADAIRLNPGNIYRKEQVKEVISAAKANKIPIRIGVNSGSLPASSLKSSPAKTMVKAVRDYLKIFEKQRFYDIMISLKASNVADTIEAYQEMARFCDYPFHLGVTATGTGSEGIIRSAIGIGTLLAEGIGDTIRVSLTGPPEDEVIAARQILQALGLRREGVRLISCPTCGRCQVDLVKIVKKVRNDVRCTKYDVRKRAKTIAIMGCEVNGPGEAREADIGIAFGRGSGILFKKGKVVKKVKVKDAVKTLLNGLTG